MIKNVITTILSKVFQGFALKLGIQPGFNVNSGYSASAQGVSVSGSLSYMGINVKTIDFSVPVGLSYEYKCFKLRFAIFQRRFSYGFESVKSKA